MSDVGGDLALLQSGPCSVAFDGELLGHTLEGVTVQVQPDLRTRAVDEYGADRADLIYQGEAVDVSTVLAERTATVIVVVFQWGYSIDSALQGWGRRPGLAGSDVAGTLVLHPLDVGDTSEDVTLHAACVTALQEVQFGVVTADRVFGVTWSGVIDESKSAGRLLGQIGLPSASASYTLSLSAEPDEGQLVLRVDGEDTDPLDSSPLDAESIQAALEALSTVGVGGVAVTGSVGAGFTLVFSPPPAAPPSVQSNSFQERIYDYDEALGPWSDVVVHTEGTDPTAEVATIYIPPGETGTIQFVANGANSDTVPIDGSDDYAALLQAALAGMTAYLFNPPSVANADFGNYTVMWPAEAGNVPDLGIASTTGLSNPAVGIDAQGTNGTSAREDVTLIADGGSFALPPSPTTHSHPLSAGAFQSAVEDALGVSVTVNRTGSGPGYTYQVTFVDPGYHDPLYPEIEVTGAALYRLDPVTVAIV